jgi:hypothetical protein
MGEHDPQDPMPDLNDEALRQQLRTTLVPNDLRSKLLQIPEQEWDHGESPKIRRTARAWRLGMIWGVAMAAGVLASIWGWQAFLLDNKPQELVQQPDTDSNQNASKPDTVVDAEIETQQWLAAQRARTETLRNEILELEIAELLDRQLVTRREPLPELSHRETVALAYALSGELMHEWAGATPVVQEQLNQVVRAFPETKGSELAAQILSN